MANIRFVREYDFYGSTYYDVVYGTPGKPSRCYTYPKEDLPETAQKWIEGKEGVTQYNSVFKRDETIYKTETVYRIEYDFRVSGEDVHAYLDNNGKGFCKEDAVRVGKELAAQGNMHVMAVAM